MQGNNRRRHTLTIRLGTTPSGLTSAYIHHPPYFFTGRMPFLPRNQQCQSKDSLPKSCNIISALVVSEQCHLYASIYPSPQVLDYFSHACFCKGPQRHLYTHLSYELCMKTLFIIDRKLHVEKLVLFILVPMFYVPVMHVC